MIRINDHSFTGEIKKMDVAGKKKNLLLQIEQTVADKYVTIYNVLIPNAIANEIFTDPLDAPNVGDFVAILNVIGYDKDGETRYRVERKEQLQILERKDPDLGKMNADDRIPAGKEK